MGRASSAGLYAAVYAAVLTRVNLGTSHGLSPVFLSYPPGPRGNYRTETDTRPISLTGGYPQHKSERALRYCAGACRENVRPNNAARKIALALRQYAQRVERAAVAPNLKMQLDRVRAGAAAPGYALAGTHRIPLLDEQRVAVPIGA